MFMCDESIISSSLNGEKKFKIKTENKAVIFDTEYHFEKTAFLSNLTLNFPNNFSPLDEEIAKLKYPYEDRPNLILASPDKKINFCIDKLEIESSEPKEIINIFCSVFKKTNPSNVLIEIDCVNSLIGEISYFDMIKIGLDINIYFLLFVFIIDESVIFGNFNMPITYKKEWKPFAIDILKSFERDVINNE